MSLLRRRILGPLVVLAAALAGAAAMVVEVAGAHALAPGFGTGLNAWSAMITVALGGLAVGYALGGLAADRWPVRLADRLLPGALALGGLAVAADALLWHRVVYALAGTGAQGSPIAMSRDWGPQLGAILSAAALFALPFGAMGAVYPMAVRLRTRAVEEVGRRSGLLSAVSAAGSVAGAAAAGFLLVPHLELETVLGLAGSALLACGAAILIVGRPGSAARAVATLLLVLAGGAVLAPPRPLPPGMLFRKSSLFGPVEVVDRDGIRYLMVAGVTQGMAWLDSPDEPTSPGFPDEPRWAERPDASGLSTHATGPADGPARRGGRFRPAFPYVHAIRSLLVENVYVFDGVLLIGLGAGHLPCELPPGCCTSVEVDPVVLQAARRFFAFPADPKLYPVHVADGRAFLLDSDRRYAAVVIDALAGLNYPYHLLTRECFELARDRLRPDGLLIVNFQGYLPRGPQSQHVGMGGPGPHDRLFRSVERTLRAVFPGVHVCTLNEQGDFGNAILAAHGAGLQFAWPADLDPSYRRVEPPAAGDAEAGGDRPAQVLTDSRNPVALWGAAIERARRRRPW